VNYTSDLNGDAIEERWLQQKRRMMVEKMLVAMQKVAAEDDQGCRDRMSSYGDGQYQEELGCADPEHNKKCHQKQRHSSDQQVGQLRLDSWKVLAQEKHQRQKTESYSDCLDE
jgi:hypothetical protein